MNIEKNHVVSIHYTLKNNAGRTIDSSDGAEPLVYIHGVGHLIPGLENALIGKTKGEKIQVTIQPKDAYGERNDQMVHNVPKTEFQEPEKLAPGMQFQVDADHGPIVLTVIEVKATEVVLDGNHPLAGETLHFNVEIIDLRKATAQELAHGHVHGPGGHDH